MKKRKVKILSLLLVLCLFFLLAACTKSHHNVLIYQVHPLENAQPMDSLKTAILQDSGISMLISYPDSNLLIVHYDRFKTHQTRIESCFSKSGNSFTLLEKKPLEESE